MWFLRDPSPKGSLHTPAGDWQALGTLGGIVTTQVQVGRMEGSLNRVRSHLAPRIPAMPQRETPRLGAEILHFLVQWFRRPGGHLPSG